MSDSPVRILIVDDERDIIEYIRAYLALNGPKKGLSFNVHDVSVPGEMLQKAEEVEPQVVLLDNDFTKVGGDPGQGFDRLLPMLRNSMPGLAIIAMTGKAKPDDHRPVLKARAWDADAYLLKDEMLVGFRLIDTILAVMKVEGQPK